MGSRTLRTNEGHKSRCKYEGGVQSIDERPGAGEIARGLSMVKDKEQGRELEE